MREHKSWKTKGYNINLLSTNAVVIRRKASFKINTCKDIPGGGGGFGEVVFRWKFPEEISAIILGCDELPSFETEGGSAT